MNRRGTDKIISVYWFAVLFIVAAGIVYMAAVFYGAPYDVREVEANIMINQIADCISTGGELNDNWNELTLDNLLEVCHLNFEVEDTYGWKNGQFYAEINYSDFDVEKGILLDSEKLKSSAGNSLLNDYCELKGKYMPICVERSFYVLDKATNKYVIKIKSVVGKAEKNVQ